MTETNQQWFSAKELENLPVGSYRIINTSLIVHVLENCPTEQSDRTIFDTMYAIAPFDKNKLF